MTGFIPRFAFWNPSTWAIPTLYWDTFSQEQRIHAICRQLGKVINYADMLGINVDDIADRLKAIEEGQLDPIIIAAIEEWFEDNQPEIMQAIDDLNGALPIEDFSAANTISDALNTLQGNIDTVQGNVDTVQGNVDAVNNIIGNGVFTPENTISEQFVKLKNEQRKEINFAIADRFIAGEFGSTGNSAAQAGCVFEQNGTLYWAQIMYDSSNSSNDRLVIRDINASNTVSDITMNLDHGYSISYNAQTKELLTHNQVNNQLLIIDVSNVYNPSIARTVNIGALGLSSYMVCWYENYYCILVWSAKRLLVIDDDLTVILDQLIDFDNYGVAQNINYDADSKLFYLACSFPNNIIEINGETFKQSNVYPLNAYYGCVYIRELQSANRVGSKIYCVNFEEVDYQLVPSLLMTDIENGTVSNSVTPYIEANGNISTVVNFTTGTLIPTNANRIFKLAGDAIKFAQSVGHDGAIVITFSANHPYQVNCQGSTVSIRANTAVTLHGIRANNSDLIINTANITMIPDIRISDSIHACIYAVNGYVTISSTSIFAIDNSQGYAGPCHIHLGASYGNLLNTAGEYTVNLSNSVLYALSSATVTKLTNYRSIELNQN